ncbi:MAG: exodeoxyribonuclease VII large subunit [Acidobacteriota bacterium]
MKDQVLPFFDGPEPTKEKPRAGTRNRPFKVSEINALARNLVEEAFPDVWIEAEISNFKAHTSGHYYFSLKDDRAQINAVMFRGANSRLRFRPSDGLAVLVRARLSLYEARGTYQAIVQAMEPLGVGSLQMAFEQLKKKLEAEGLFARSRKKPIPILPRRVGVVTSPSGAALRDILRVLERRASGLSILIAPCLVQGEGAAPQIAEAIRSLNAMAAATTTPDDALDVIILARGGGSMEDLWPFNEESVARAVADSHLPVISAVGHETDVTIADFVADLRAATPSAAAEIVVKSREELLQRVDSLATRLEQSLRLRILGWRGRVQELTHSRAFARVEAAMIQLGQRTDDAVARLERLLRDRIREGRRRLGILGERLRPRHMLAEIQRRRARLAVASDTLWGTMRAGLKSRKEKTTSYVSLLRSLSPLAVLERGYAICQEEETGSILTSASEVPVDTAITVRLARGRLGARVSWTRQGQPSHGRIKNRGEDE